MLLLDVIIDKLAYSNYNNIRKKEIFVIKGRFIV